MTLIHHHETPDDGYFKLFKTQLDIAYSDMYNDILLAFTDEATEGYDRLLDAYKVKPMSYENAIKKAKEWEYTLQGKIPIGIFYKESKPTLTDKYPALSNLEKKKISWKKLKRKIPSINELI